MKTILEKNVPGIVVTGEASREATGSFEVVAKGMDVPLHSKLNGDGYLDTDLPKLQAVVAKCQELAAGSA